tara:strand:+ start:835 stop:1284 length:450 start_codon:yes stop_codon:yes gene_type:complete
MPYVGSLVQQSFQSIPSVQRFNGTGSATAFTLDRNVTNVQDVLISVDGVVQDSNAYSITGGTSLVFSEAPSSGTGNIFVNFLGVTDGSVVPPEANKGNFKNGGMFRVNSQTLDVSTTIEATENATVTGPLTISTDITLTVNSGGNLAII